MLSDPRNGFLIEHGPQPPPEQSELRAMEGELNELHAAHRALNKELDAAEDARARRSAKPSSTVSGGEEGSEAVVEALTWCVEEGLFKTEDVAQRLQELAHAHGDVQALVLPAASQLGALCKLLRAEIERVREARRAVVVRLKCAHLRLLDDIEESRLQVVQLAAGSGFGEIALMRNQPRAATVIAGKECTLLTITKEDYNRVMMKSQLLLLEETAALLRKVPGFEAWVEYDLWTLGMFMPEVRWVQGATIIHQGQVPGVIYFIKSGQCRLSRQIKSARGIVTLDVAILGPGNTILEHALLEHTAVAESYVAHSELVLLSMSAIDVFKKLDPRTLATLREAARLRSQHRGTHAAHLLPFALERSDRLHRAAERPLRARAMPELAVGAAGQLTVEQWQCIKARPPPPPPPTALVGSRVIACVAVHRPVFSRQPRAHRPRRR
jgi:CRP-like cAMP-binding protein